MVRSDVRARLSACNNVSVHVRLHDMWLMEKPPQNLCPQLITKLRAMPLKDRKVCHLAARPIRPIGVAPSNVVEDFRAHHVSDRANQSCPGETFTLRWSTRDLPVPVGGSWR